jgi:peptidyl-prolyl cis-trans isomerase SurA
MSRRALALALGAWLSAATAAQAVVFDRIVAIVNDDIITLSELDEAGKPILDRLLGGQPGGPALEKRLYEARRQILRMLVDQKLAEQEISRLGISVSREDVDRVIEDVKRESTMTEEQLREALKEEGISWEQYRKQVEEQLCRARLINEEVRTKIVITDERCRGYYEQHPEEFHLYDEAKVEHVLLAVPPGSSEKEREAQRRRAQEVLAMLQAGADFATLARQYSQAPSAPDGGQLGWLRVEEMAPYLKEIVARLEPGQLSEVVSTEQGYQILRVKEFHQGGTRPFEQVKDEIYRKLFQQDVDREYETWLKNLRQRAYIKLTF